MKTFKYLLGGILLLISIGFIVLAGYQLFQELQLPVLLRTEVYKLYVGFSIAIGFSAAIVLKSAE